ncbi:DUF2510 domain-containing protein [Streptacidiphilus sp. 4-A2]|nr:DUF2510 domain-containing protein [Streptacidiphilus sp. 4-A2]
MSVPPSAGPEAEGRPTAGYYPDPSIPGYVRYWDGDRWLPGTSRPAPSDGEALPPPRAAAHAGASPMSFVPPPAPFPERTSLRCRRAPRRCPGPPHCPAPPRCPGPTRPPRWRSPGRSTWTRPRACRCRSPPGRLSLRAAGTRMPRSSTA